MITETSALPTTSVRNGKQLKKLLVASDHPITRAGVIATIVGEPGFQICGEVASCDEVLAFLDATAVELLILDVSTRNGMGIQLVQQCKKSFGQLRILVLSNYEECLSAGRMLQVGTMGYLSTAAPQEMLVQAVRSLIAGHVYCSPELMTRMLGHTDHSDPISGLTQREFQVFELIGQGNTSRCIARLLKLCVHTVETYRERLKTKLDASNGADLTFQAIVWRLLHE